LGPKIITSALDDARETRKAGAFLQRGPSRRRKKGSIDCKAALATGLLEEISRLTRRRIPRARSISRYRQDYFTSKERAARLPGRFQGQHEYHCAGWRWRRDSYQVLERSDHSTRRHDAESRISQGNPSSPVFERLDVAASFEKGVRTRREVRELNRGSDGDFTSVVQELNQQ